MSLKQIKRFNKKKKSGHLFIWYEISLLLFLFHYMLYKVSIVYLFYTKSGV